MINISAESDGSLKLSNQIKAKDWGLSDAMSDNGAGWTALGGPLGISHTGLEINAVTALKSSVVMACVRILCGDIAKLNLRLLKRTRDGIWIEERKHPLSRLLRKPNKRMTQADMITSWVFSLILTGNAFSAIPRDGAGRPAQLVPLLPSLVSISEDQHGDLYYYVMSRLLSPNSSMWHEEDMMHVRTMSLDNGVRGASLVQLCAETIGLSLATTQLAAEIFKNGANFNGFLTTNSPVNKESLEQIRDAWSRNQAGLRNNWKTPVLGNGFDFKPINMNPEQAQMVEARTAIVREVGMIFGVPLFKLGVNEKSSYNSIDAQQQDYVDSSLIPITNPIEQELNKALLFDDEFDDYRFEFDYSVLLRGDIKTRSEYHHQLLADGVFSVNEVRREMNLPGIGDEGDIRTKPLNVGTVGDTSGLPTYQIDAPLKETETETAPVKE